MTIDDLEAGLRALPALDVPPAAAARLRARALAVLAQERRLAASPLLRAWHRVLEPALSAAAVVLLLGWAAGVLAALR